MTSGLRRVKKRLINKVQRVHVPPFLRFVPLGYVTDGGNLVVQYFSAMDGKTN